MASDESTDMRQHVRSRRYRSLLSEDGFSSLEVVPLWFEGTEEGVNSRDAERCREDEISADKDVFICRAIHMQGIRGLTEASDGLRAIGPRAARGAGALPHQGACRSVLKASAGPRKHYLRVHSRP